MVGIVMADEDRGDIQRHLSRADTGSVLPGPFRLVDRHGLKTKLEQWRMTVQVCDSAGRFEG